MTKQSDKVGKIIQQKNFYKTFIQSERFIALSAGAVEYTDCTSAEG